MISCLRRHSCSRAKEGDFYLCHTILLIFKILIIQHHSFLMQEQLDEIKRLLDSRGIKYETSEHEPVYTSEDAARIRGEELKTGAKALIFSISKAYRNLEEDPLLHRFKAGKEFILCIVPGNMKIDTKKLNEILSCRDVRMAPPEEVLNVSG